MSFFYILKTAITGLRANKVRSALTILGIVIGIASIIMIMSLGQGARAIILNQLSGWGSLTISLEPGAMPKGISDAVEIYTNSIRDRDLEAIRKPSNVPNVTEITPVAFASESLVYKGERSRAQIMGSTADYMNFFNVEPEHGVFFYEDAIKAKSKVVVLGWEIKDELFGESEAVGKKIKIKDQWFKIIGVFPKTGTVSMQNVDKMVLIPYSTVQNYITGTDYFQAIVVQASEEKYIDSVARDITTTIRELHNITDPDKDDFHVATMDQAADIISSIMGALTFFLGAVAAISLVVGGVGIMNIMLVSVTERTREIGLRKALGATSSDVLSQFLFESVILTGLGGLLGVAIGSGLSLLISYVVNNFTTYSWIFVFPLSGAILGVGVATVIGLIFGIYPAKTASRKSPIEALRYE
ncbi:MAG: ABC transporter permease [Candidatus Peregrinibacteria bacterium]|nr:ABC transporter permease [Candidatus Peregrinibacteria bacterium]